MCPPDHVECFHVPPKKLINKSQGVSSYQYGEVVILAILGMPAKLTLHLKENDEKKQETIFLPRKSVVVFSGEARYDMHSCAHSMNISSHTPSHINTHYQHPLIHLLTPVSNT